MDTEVSWAEVCSSKEEHGQESLGPEIVNVVADFNVGCDLNLRDIALRALNTEYCPSKFNGLIMRIREPNTTARMFSSGKMVVTGAKTEAASKLACRKLMRILRKLGYGVGFLDWRVLNMVAVARVPFAIDLIRLDRHLSRLVIQRGNPDPGLKLLSSKWEPEIFPPIVCRMKEPKLTLLIFSSGKTVLVGCKTKQDIDRAFEYILPVLVELERRP